MCDNCGIPIGVRIGVGGLHYVQHLFLDLLEEVFHSYDNCLHFGMIALRTEGVYLAPHLLCDEAEFLALSRIGCMHCLNEVVEVFCEALFFFVYVEFLDVENHFLFEPSFVVLCDRDFRESVLDSGTDFSHSFFFEGFDLLQERSDGVDSFCKEPFELFAFCPPVCHVHFCGFPGNRIRTEYQSAGSGMPSS